jgi:hypothetical protein
LLRKTRQFEVHTDANFLQPRELLRRGIAFAGVSGLGVGLGAIGGAAAA